MSILIDKRQTRILESIAAVALDGAMLLITTLTTVFGGITKKKPALYGKEGEQIMVIINSSFGGETISGLSR